jgi:hypothetical protein
MALSTFSWILIIIIVVGLVIILYANTSQQNNLSNKAQEPFFALTDNNNGPLVTFDGFDTKDFKFETDALTRYDPTFMSMGDNFSDWNSKVPECKTPINNLGFDQDCFIKYGKRKLRRDLVPSNYLEGQNYAMADFDKAHNVQVTNRKWNKYSTIAPQGSNTYFSAGY